MICFLWTRAQVRLCVLVTKSCPTLCDPMDCSSLSSSVHGNSPGKNTGEVAIPVSRDLPNPGIEPRSSTVQADSLPSEPPGKPSSEIRQSQKFTTVYNDVLPRGTECLMWTLKIKCGKAMMLERDMSKEVLILIYYFISHLRWVLCTIQQSWFSFPSTLPCDQFIFSPLFNHQHSFLILLTDKMDAVVRKSSHDPHHI